MIYKSNIVALYDENDVCVFVAETWKELANFLGKTIESTQSSMAHILKKTGGYDRRNFVCDGKKLTPYLIDMGEEEELCSDEEE